MHWPLDVKDVVDFCGEPDPKDKDDKRSNCRNDYLDNVFSQITTSSRRLTAAASLGSPSKTQDISRYGRMHYLQLPIALCIFHTRGHCAGRACPRSPRWPTSYPNGLHILSIYRVFNVSRIREFTGKWIMHILHLVLRLRQVLAVLLTPRAKTYDSALSEIAHLPKGDIGSLIYHQFPAVVFRSTCDYIIT